MASKRLAASDGETTGCVFDVKRFALHDGPGIRTTVFLQGCPLSCLWCQNPESQARGPQVLHWAARCRACRACEAACPEGAVTVAGGVRHYLPARCTHCGACISACPEGALNLSGKRVTAGEIARVAARDRPFYANSGGGVTLSGGEPLAQPAFTAALLRLCHGQGLHTALDTTAHAPWSVLRRLLPDLDLVLLDLKAIDPARHRRLTGVDNRLILANAAHLAASGVPLVVRIPLIPGQNDDDANLHGLALFLAGLPDAGRVDLLPYNRLAESKYVQWGFPYRLPGLATSSVARMEAAREIVAASGWTVAVVWGLGLPAAPVPPVGA